MKTFLIRTINAILVISWELFIFFPAQCILHFLGTLVNLYSIVRKYATSNIPEDGTKIAPIYMHTNDFIKAFKAAVLLQFGIISPCPSHNHNTHDEGTKQATKPPMPVDY